MSRLRILGLVILMMLGGISQPVRAQVTAYAAGQGAVSSIEVGVEVRASVRSRCGFASGGAPMGSIDQADFDRTGFSKDFPIQLNCSGASRIAVASANGGMATSASANGFSSKAPYQVALRVVADNGTSASASCNAAALGGGGACSFAGTATSANGLRLAGASTRNNGSYLRISAPSYDGATPLIEGRYTDTLTITVSVTP
ncbi:hypothetical protein [Sphingomonas sp. DT-207]|uniref:hypothetical protein n=1 Tax=Sphingomonas sp. DT-207 TaxID=3396167 RepID=UPI003F53FA84